MRTTWHWPELLFLKGMTGALAPFSYLVQNDLTFSTFPPTRILLKCR
jgi:hypothetical protein